MSFPRAIWRPFLRLRRHPRRILLLCAASICVMGLLDLALPHRIIMGVLYLPPILVSVRFYGRRAATLLCFLAASFWGLASTLNARGRLEPARWLLLERLVLFILIVWIVDALLKSARRSGRLLARERRASRNKSEMLSIVSHEVNNSMAMIGLAVRELEVEDRPAASREEVYGIVKRNVARMGLVARNFLSEARMASGHLRLRPEPKALDDVVDDVVAALKPLADDKAIAVSASVVPPGLRAVFDRDALEVVLANLVGNAIKYTPDGGRVDVEARLIEGPPRRAVVAVADTGIGVAPADRARVLAGFERTEAGRRQASGFGLGLKIAHDIVKAHGGTLVIESAPGSGSKFSFELPA